MEQGPSFVRCWETISPVDVSWYWRVPECPMVADVWRVESDDDCH